MVHVHVALRCWRCVISAGEIIFVEVEGGEGGALRGRYDGVFRR